MKAIQLREFGGADAFEYVETPDQVRTLVDALRDTDQRKCAGAL